MTRFRCRCELRGYSLVGLTGERDPHGGDCVMIGDKSCPLCEQPFCAACLTYHHKCREQPQDIEVPERKVEEVAS